MLRSAEGITQWVLSMEEGRAKSAERAEAELVEQIRRVFAANKGRYGSPRVRQALRQDGIEMWRESRRTPDARK